MNDIYKGLAYGIAQVQLLDQQKQEYADMMRWCEQVLELEDKHLVPLLRGVEHHLGREVGLWPDDPSCERAVTVRSEIDALNAQFAESGVAIDAPQTSDIKFL